MSKYDLINSINSRGTFCLTRACLPHMYKGTCDVEAVDAAPVLWDTAQLSAHRTRAARRLSVRSCSGC
jgi:hypothetical protein